MNDIDQLERDGFICIEEVFDGDGVAGLVDRSIRFLGMGRSGFVEFLSDKTDAANWKVPWHQD